MVNRTEAFKRWPSFLTFIILLLKFDFGVDGFAHLKNGDHRQHYSQRSLDPIHLNDKNCYYRSDILICSASLDNKESPQKLSNSAAVSSIQEDPYTSFPLFDKILFKLFSASVTAEMQKSSDKEPKNYGELMDLINEMTKTRSVQRVNDQGKNMLKRLFPPWLLTQYKWMFAAPFPEVPTLSSVSTAFHHHHHHQHLHCIAITITTVTIITITITIMIIIIIHLTIISIFTITIIISIFTMIISCQEQGQKPADDTCLNAD